MNRRFFIEQVEEFLTGGNVETEHNRPIPISAGFIIEQNARILEILEKFMTSFESQLQADIASLIDSNTKIVALNNQQVQQIADLQGKLAAAQNQIANGGTVTQADLDALNDIAGKIATTAATTSDTANASGTAAAPSVPVATPQQPIVSAPVDQTQATDPTAVPTPATPAPQAPIVSGGGSGSDSTTTPGNVSTTGAGIGGSAGSSSGSSSTGSGSDAASSTSSTGTSSTGQ